MVRCLSIAALLACVAAPGAAHHAPSAQFDVSRILDATGRLVRVEWTSPHGYLHFEIKGAADGLTGLALETPPPATWRRLGVASRGNLLVGLNYRFQYSPSRDGAPVGLLIAMHFPDGRKVDIRGQPQEGGSN